ncbi:MAG: hypothetical protein J3R72DRAFT_441855 [Linnemannia gamsii]|nr:MAG: hypothetical protein J3R72DRAFT_441855 [Linnemannia gamsii]
MVHEPPLLLALSLLGPVHPLSTTLLYSSFLSLSSPLLSSPLLSHTTPTPIHSTVNMSNKPSAKAIAKLNASILFPAIRSEIIANPSLFAIRGFFIFNITKKTVPMTEWYLLFQGFDAPAVVSQKRPDVPKAKRDEDPIPVAILQIEDSDLLNFMSGGLTGPRGIVSGRIKIAGAIELAEQLEQIFLKAKGQEKTLAYLEQKRGRSEKARARL